MISEENISSVAAMTETLTKSAIHQEKTLRTNTEDQNETKLENMREILPPFDNTTDEVSSIFSQEASK
jgi:hypothetical protein